MEPVRTEYVKMPDGAELCCRIYGEGERTVFLLHGNGEDFTCFKMQYADFAKHYRVIAIDSRGHGSSTHGKGVTILKMAEDLSYVMDALEVSKASVVGFSDGANVAVYFALRWPWRLEKLVLAGANLYPKGVKFLSQLPCEAGYCTCKLFGLFSENAKKEAEILGLMVLEPQIAASELSQIHTPTLVLAGDRDMIKPEHTTLIARSIPDAKLKMIKNSDHFLFQRQPVAVNAEILRFLGEN